MRSEIIQRRIQLQTDSGWNANFPKMVDNAILFFKSKDKNPKKQREKEHPLLKVQN
jgi:hypothetical protein